MTVTQLHPADRVAVTEVLATAFLNYPVLRYMIGREAVDYEDSLRRLVGYFCDIRLVNEWPVLGSLVDGQLVGVALVSDPTYSNSAALEALETTVRAQVGERVWSRIERFERLSSAADPVDPHHFVGMLGVLPWYQRRGVGRMLLGKAMEMSKEVGTAGVSLTTEDPGNLLFYERLGFTIVARSEIDEMTSWCLRWPNPEYGNPASHIRV